MGTSTALPLSVVCWIALLFLRLDVVKSQACGGNISQARGSVYSPGFPGGYSSNKICTWLITVPENHHVLFRINTLNLVTCEDCACDYVEIRDGHEFTSPVLGRFCGRINPDTVRSTGNKVNVKLRAKHAHQWRGFAADFISEINPEIQTEATFPEIYSESSNLVNEELQQHEGMEQKNIKLAKEKLVNWFLGRRKNGTETSKWGHDLPRIAVALFLGDQDFFTSGNRTMEEMNYELTIQLLSQMAGGGELRRRDLSLSIHALTVACVDPKNFHGRDLVSELRAHVSTGNGTAFELLVLCNAGDTMSDKDVESIAEIFDSQHRPFWTDNQAMATLALACVSGRGGVTVDERTLLDMAQELKKRQFRNGTVDNLKTTALVVQALIATRSLERDFDLSAAISVLLRAQREDGSVGSLLDSYYVLPVLANSSLLNVTSNHCKKPNITESEALSELRGSRGRRVRVQFSVWIGTEVDLRRTWTLKVPANSSLYGLLETVDKLDSRQQVEYNVIDGKPYVSSLMGLQDDVETGFYWFTYLRTQNTEDTKRVEESPVDVKIRANQELILWYKSRYWNKHATP